MLESSSDINRGFTWLLLGFAVLQLLSLVLIFYMPEGPVARKVKGQKGAPAVGRG